MPDPDAWGGFTAAGLAACPASVSATRRWPRSRRPRCRAGSALRRPINHPSRVKLCPSFGASLIRTSTTAGVTQLRSTYQIRVHGSIPGGLLQNLPPATEIVPAGLILRISQLDDAGLIGLLDALQIADIDVLEVRPEACTMEM